MARSGTTTQDLKLLPPPISFTDGNVSETWSRFKQRLEFYFQALAVAATSHRKRIGILMTALGDSGLDIFNSFTDIDTDSTYDDVIEAFDNYCNPRKNTVYERYVFSQIVQADKSVDMFIVELKSQARKCEFAEQEFDNLIRDRIVVGVRNPDVRKELLKDPDLTLVTATSVAKIWERSEAEAKEISRGVAETSKSFEVHRVQQTSRQSPATRSVAERERFEKPRSATAAQTASPAADRTRCNGCGYEHRGDTCPAQGQECNFCHKLNHFASVCRKRLQKLNVATVEKPADQVTPAATDRDQKEEAVARSLDVLELYAISSAQSKNAWYTQAEVMQQLVVFKVDSGAECNTITLADFRRLDPQPSLQSTSAALRPYGAGELIVPTGEFTVDVSHREHRCPVRFFVFDLPTNADNILGLPTIEHLGLVRRTFAVETAKRESEGKLNMIKAHPIVFDGKLGTAPGFVGISTKPSCIPVTEKPRRFPIALKKKLCSALTDLEAADIIQRVDEPTEWVSNLIAVTKPDGSLRTCLDPKYLNAAIIVPKCEIPKCDDIFTELDEMEYYTVFDLKDGFWQMMLDEASSKLTTFNSPLGRFRWKRLVMGISSAPEIFMNRMRQLFGDLPGVFPYFDDIIVAGANEEEHDKNVEAVLCRAEQVGIKFNRNKVQYKQKTVNYLGFQVSAGGVKPLTKHSDAIEKMPQPEDRNGVLRLLGMTRYLARFIPNLSANTEALRSLTHKNVPFEWKSEHNTEFENIKKRILNATNLRFYKPAEQLFIQTDSSKSGIGCCIYQNDAPIAYASRALSKTEQNYAQIEKELLAVVFSLEKFHDYTYGRKVVVHSDHKPLVSIVKKPISELTPRLQRLRLRLLRYNFDLIFQPGKELFVADTLSRVYLADEPADESYQLLDVHSCANVVASPAKLAELVAATAADQDIQTLKIYMRGGWPKSKKRLTPALARYRTIVNDLSFRNNLLFFQNRLVVPTSQIAPMLLQLHAGHLNVHKTKILARNTLFWLGMAADIEMYIGSCDTCNKFRKNNAKETLLPFPCATRPWQRLHTDILTFDAKDYLVVYDAYSQWLELFSLRSKTASEITTHFTMLFSRFGVPQEIVSDNVPYNSVEWLAFADTWQFTPLFSSPRYTQANGASEKAVSIAKGVLRKNINVPYALLQYRNAPIPHLGSSPAQLLMGRSLRTRVPVPESSLQPSTPNHATIVARKLAHQSTQKLYYNRSAQDLPELVPGDEVYYKKDLADTSWSQGTVVSAGTSPRSFEVQDCDTNSRYLRNRRFIRKPVRFRDT